MTPVTIPLLVRRAGAVGAVALAACIAGGMHDRNAFFQAWLVNWLFLLGAALGSLMLVMIHELTGGEWGLVLRRPLEAAAITLPLIAVFAMPLAFGLSDLFQWARPAVVSDVLEAKRWYLNAPAFIARNALWLVVWTAFALAFHRFLDRPRHARDRAAGTRIAVAGLIVYFLSVTFTAIDWVASLIPEWFSSAIGIRLGVSQFLSAFSFAALFVALRNDPFVAARDLQDFGNLLLTFAMTWAYFAFAQYLIVWGEDLPHETSWYWPRTQTTWHWLALAIAALNFVVPSLAMLFRGIKRSRRALAAIAAAVLVGQWLDAFWLVAPSLRPDAFAVHWLDGAALVAQGGLWLAFMLSALSRLPVPTVAPHDETPVHG
jgi:hypothetical protein